MSETNWCPWVEWSGGECPIPGLSGYYYQIKCAGSPDVPIYATCLASNRRWTHKEWPTDIIAYRLRAPTGKGAGDGTT